MGSSDRAERGTGRTTDLGPSLPPFLRLPFPKRDARLSAGSHLLRKSCGIASNDHTLRRTPRNCPGVLGRSLLLMVTIAKTGRLRRQENVQLDQAFPRYRGEAQGSITRGGQPDQADRTAIAGGDPGLAGGYATRRSGMKGRVRRAAA